MLTETNSKATRNNSEQLREKIGLLTPALNRAAHVFWSHPSLARLYPELLFSLHCINRASVPLMEAALRSASAQPRSDQVAPLLAEYLARHIPEELHHDEWTLDDLEVLGWHRTEVLKRVPSPTTAAMVGAQYYLVLHVHPVALMGYLAVLEGEPPSVEDVEAVIAITGLPREAFRTYLEHARLDFNHRDDFDDMLDRMPLTPDHAELIAISAFQTINWVRALFEEMVELHRSESGVTALA